MLPFARTLVLCRTMAGDHVLHRASYSATFLMSIRTCRYNSAVLACLHPSPAIQCVLSSATSARAPAAKASYGAVAGAQHHVEVVTSQDPDLHVMHTPTRDGAARQLEPLLGKVERGWERKKCGLLVTDEKGSACKQAGILGAVVVPGVSFWYPGGCAVTHTHTHRPHPGGDLRDRLFDTIRSRRSKIILSRM
jgi:hypothetical protein